MIAHTYIHTFRLALVRALWNSSTHKSVYFEVPNYVAYSAIVLLSIVGGVASLLIYAGNVFFSPFYISSRGFIFCPPRSCVAWLDFPQGAS